MKALLGLSGGAVYRGCGGFTQKSEKTGQNSPDPAKKGGGIKVGSRWDHLSA